MDEQFNDKAQEAADQLNQAADQSWQNLEAAANQAAEQTQAAAQQTQASADQAYQAWQAQQPAAPQMPAYGPNDPQRWTGELYTPEVTPPSQPYQQAPQSDYIDAQRVGMDGPPPAQKEKDKFPVWAIVLIVLLVLCICVACTILPFAFLGRFFTEAFRSNLIIP